ncbi:MAG: hypothetical protein ACK4UO_09470 [Pseudolabrys sp.]
MTLASPWRIRLPFATLALAFALAGCETTGQGPAPVAEGPPQPPMTHSRAAQECWMKTEKGSASVSLDHRADIVTKCIEDKMKAAGAPAPAPRS